MDENKFMKRKFSMFNLINDIPDSAGTKICSLMLLNVYFCTYLKWFYESLILLFYEGNISEHP